MLEFDLLATDDEKLEVITALQSSNEGRDQYEELCRKRTKFLEMVDYFSFLLNFINFRTVKLLHWINCHDTVRICRGILSIIYMVKIVPI